MKNDKKINDEWLTTLSGNSVINANKKWQLQAKLVKAAIKDIKADYDYNYEKNKELRIKQFKKLLREEGILTSKQTPLLTKLVKWLSALFFGATLVWATNELIHFDKPLLTEEAGLNQPKKDDINKPFALITDKQGSFTVFWSRLQLQLISPQRFNDPIEIKNSTCGPQNLTLAGCVNLAQKNNANAHFNIGLMYEKGIEVEENYKKAAEWYKKAVALGNTEASFNLNYLLEKKLIE